MSSNTSAMDEHLANMRALRAIVGPEPKEQQLVELLRRFQWVLLRVEWQCTRATPPVASWADETAKPTETAPLNRAPPRA